MIIHYTLVCPNTIYIVSRFMSINIRKSLKVFLSVYDNS